MNVSGDKSPEKGLFGMNLSLGTSVEAGRAFEARDDA